MREGTFRNWRRAPEGRHRRAHRALGGGGMSLISVSLRQYSGSARNSIRTMSRRLCDPDFIGDAKALADMIERTGDA